MIQAFAPPSAISMKLHYCNVLSSTTSNLRFSMFPNVVHFSRIYFMHQFQHFVLSHGFESITLNKNNVGKKPLIQRNKLNYLSEMDNLKEVVFYQAHKMLSQDLLEFLHSKFTASNGTTGLPSEWGAFKPILEDMDKQSGSRVRHLVPYFLNQESNWGEYTRILDMMVYKYHAASASVNVFEFQLKFVENCWKSGHQPLSWSNINNTERVSMSKM